MKLKWRENSFYYKPEWRDLRRKVFRSYGRICMRCKAVPKQRYNLHIDHIKPRSKYPELELEFSNLQVLCKPCNTKKADTDETDYRPKDGGPTRRDDLKTPKHHWTNGLTAEEVWVAKQAIDEYRKTKRKS